METVIKCKCDGEMWTIGTIGIRCVCCGLWLPEKFVVDVDAANAWIKKLEAGATAKDAKAI